MSVARGFRRLFVHAPADPVTFWRGRAADPGWQSVMWRNTAYNACAHEDQWRGIVDHLPARRGSVLDLGCGTGRLTGPLMALFDDYVGVDLDTMVEEAKARNPVAADKYVVSRVQDYCFPRERFDLVLSMACVSAALGPAEMPRAVEGMAGATKPGGRVILLDPFHTSPALARAGRMHSREVIDLFARQGLSLVTWTGMHFIPVRLLLGSARVPLSPPLARAAYRAGELCRLLAPRLFSDYQLIVFEKPEVAR